MCFWSTADKRRPLKNVVVRAAPRHPVSLIQLYLLTVSDGTFWIRFSTQKQCVNHHHRLRVPLLDKLREQYGVGPLCSELHIAPSTYYHCQQQRHHPDKRSARAQRDDWLKKEIQRVYDENHKVYGVRKVWRQLLREGIRVARCTVARLMAVMGLAGVLRGKKVRTTISRKAVAAGDRVNRQFVVAISMIFWCVPG